MIPAPADTLVLLAFAPGLILTVMMLRQHTANPMHVLAAVVCGVVFGGKAQVFAFAQRWPHSLRELMAVKIAPLGAGVGTSLLVAIVFALSRPPKSHP